MNTIYLVDDHPMLRGGLSHIVQQDGRFQICGEASTAMQAMNEIPQLRPDVVVMDITLPDKSGLELIKDLLALHPTLRVLVFSMHDEMLYAERVIRAGGKGYLVKGSDSEQFTQALREVIGGGIYLSERVSAHILNRMSVGHNREPAFGPATLTDRELEIFQMLGQGLGTPQIAAKLHISPRTVDAHRNNIRMKLSLPDAAAVLREAVIWVESGGLEGSTAESSRSSKSGE
ncbi:response regulator transcription factor [Luteolibacter sp. GHJ8]|uniref:Response regulator transcription factor n=1 Tax=Luteolibacter rhizosphaerae TaxID=2989719 RepID=A0ABT3G8E9_9BACT|nr:response regulator transcription factor [Luteolibacter rhizosphaerae]MCW1915864.1 response regulator transcription factor [Luteolibacter rhizosphaerae]